MKSLLILLHCESNTGYAIAPLERTFFQMAMKLLDDDSTRIHFAYPSMSKGPSPTLPANFKQYVVIDAKSNDPQAFADAHSYIRRNEIDTIFGFDQPVTAPIFRHFRAAGVKRFVSYWGAPMSSVFGPVRRMLKRIEVLFRRFGPDHYIFESDGMARAATLGRGISPRRVSVIPLGIDITRFSSGGDQTYVYDQMGLPPLRRLFFYAGHMEPRKGVAVIMQAANLLGVRRAEDDWHVVLFGNKGNEHAPYVEMLTEEARRHVTFGGYRQDLPRIQSGCYAAIIASCGWDSFPRSALEVQASGLPLLASDLPGLNETLEDGATGIIFPTGNAEALASAMERLLNEPPLRTQMSAAARRRIEAGYTGEVQLERLVSLMKRVAG